MQIPTRHTSDQTPLDIILGRRPEDHLQLPPGSWAEARVNEHAPILCQQAVMLRWRSNGTHSGKRHGAWHGPLRLTPGQMWLSLGELSPLSRGGNHIEIQIAPQQDRLSKPVHLLIEQIPTLTPQALHAMQEELNQNPTVISMGALQGRNQGPQAELVTDPTDPEERARKLIENWSRLQHSSQALEGKHETLPRTTSKSGKRPSRGEIKRELRAGRLRQSMPGVLERGSAPPRGSKRRPSALTPANLSVAAELGSCERARINCIHELQSIIDHASRTGAQGAERAKAVSQLRDELASLSPLRLPHGIAQLPSMVDGQALRDARWQRSARHIHDRRYAETRAAASQSLSYQSLEISNTHGEDGQATSWESYERWCALQVWKALQMAGATRSGDHRNGPPQPGHWEISLPGNMIATLDIQQRLGNSRTTPDCCLHLGNRSLILDAKLIDLEEGSEVLAHELDESGERYRRICSQVRNISPNHVTACLIHPGISRHARLPSRGESGVAWLRPGEGESGTAQLSALLLRWILEAQASALQDNR